MSVLHVLKEAKRSGAPMDFDAIYAYLMNASRVFLLGWILLLLLTFATVFRREP